MKYYSQYEQKPISASVLYKKIETLKDARAFIRHLVQTGNMYHPDDDALECWNNGESSFEEHQAHMHPVNTRKLIDAGSGDTVITRSESGKTFRQIRTGWSQAWEAEDAPVPLKMPYQDVLVGDLLGAIEEHDIEPLIHSGAGQSVGYFNAVRPVAEIMAELVNEASEVLNNQASFLRKSS